jgi:hypothetical protein
MEKVILTKEQAIALDMAREDLFASEVVATHARLLNDDNDSWAGRFEPLNRLNLDEVIRALYVGCEIEKSPEEQIKDFYTKAPLNDRADYGTRYGVRQTLQMLGIEIEGINA